MSCGKEKELERIGNASLLLTDSLTVNKLNKRKIVFFTLGIFFVLISLANPQMGTKSEVVKTNGFDVFLALDISKSMLAADMPPSRLDRLKRLSEELIRSLTGNRIGLIVFAGNAYLQTPLTTDYRALLLFLQTLSPDIVSNQGTNFSSAISVALRYFSYQKANGKALIILSDGENHEPGLEDAARQAAQKEFLRLLSVLVRLKEQKFLIIPVTLIHLKETKMVILSFLNCRKKIYKP